MKKVRGILKSETEVRLVEPVGELSPGTEVEVLVPDAPTPGGSDRPRTGAELVARLEKAGIIGMWKDRDDIGSTHEFARELRRRASRRHHDP